MYGRLGSLRLCRRRSYRKLVKITQLLQNLLPAIDIRETNAGLKPQFVIHHQYWVGVSQVT